MDLRKLKSLAISGKWEVINNVLPKLSVDNRYQSWAYSKGIHNSNENVRDLSASIIEAAKSQGKFGQIRPELAIMMKLDHGKYSSFRAACALAKHGPAEYEQEVKRVLLQFEDDKDVGKIAKSYLKKLK